MKIKRVAIGFLLISIPLFYFFFEQSTMNQKAFFEDLLAQADIKINGDRPWDIHVHNSELYNRILAQGSLGLGQSYMDGWWDCQRLDQFFDKLFQANLEKKVQMNWSTIVNVIKAHCINLQSKIRAREVAEQHYDLDNALFAGMLDKNMVYSCGYWKGQCSKLDDAQEHKLDLICKKLALKPGMKMLDIGCGWGGLACHAARNYGVEVVGITISKEQAEYAQKKAQGLPVSILLQDYRDVQGMYDRIVSVGMFEHVGYKNYKEFMQVASRCLKPDGLFLLHTIGGNVSNTHGDAWINTYIFPNGMLPSTAQISKAIEGTFVMEDWHNFGADYDKTLMAWHQNFDTSWQTLKDQYGDRFYRMWKYYLLSCAGLFRSRKAQLWQVVLSKNGVAGGYTSVR